jgi:hypothetical protein
MPPQGTRSRSRSRHHDFVARLDLAVFVARHRVLLSLAIAVARLLVLLSIAGGRDVAASCTAKYAEGGYTDPSMPDPSGGRHHIIILLQNH